ncbi:MAG: hypothetical protein MK193_04190 [Lentisphaeria bacterium]|nr:hypothetical protein [Lentisphaeria bacterium]
MIILQTFEEDQATFDGVADFAAIDFQAQVLGNLSPEKFDMVVKEQDVLNLKSKIALNGLHADMHLYNGQISIEDLIRYFQLLCHRCTELGIDGVVLDLATAYTITEGLSRTEAQSQFANALNQLMDATESFKTKFYLTNNSTKLQDFNSDLEDLIEVIEIVGNHRLRLAADLETLIEQQADPVDLMRFAYLTDLIILNQNAKILSTDIAPALVPFLGALQIAEKSVDVLIKRSPEIDEHAVKEAVEILHQLHEYVESEFTADMLLSLNVEEE